MADHQPHRVIPLAPKHSSLAGEVLGQAFLDDPVWCELMPDSRTRQSMLARMFAGLARTTSAANGIAETTSGIEAVALWLGPGQQVGFWATVRSGMAMPRFVMKLPAEDRRKMLAVLQQMDERREALMPEPHWYLEAIGVEPRHQGAGFGTALVRAGLQRADHDRTSVYLETETEGNVGYYEHLGFEVVDCSVAVGLDLPIWHMARL
ncbi:MAG: GNAT family N-acetyltransferase [Acidimicrobiia bacterium]